MIIGRGHRSTRKKPAPCHFVHPGLRGRKPATNRLSYFFIILSGVRLSPLGTAATTGLLYQPQMIDDGDYGAVGGMRIGRGNGKTRRKRAPAPLCPPQIPHDQTPGSNPGRRGGKPATNSLSYGAATDSVKARPSSYILNKTNFSVWRNVVTDLKK
jgi:hypothetical protein